MLTLHYYLMFMAERICTKSIEGETAIRAMSQMRCWLSLDGRLDGRLEVGRRVGDDRELE